MNRLSPSHLRPCRDEWYVLRQLGEGGTIG
jgi:hypothetical protein